MSFQCYQYSSEHSHFRSCQHQYHGINSFRYPFLCFSQSRKSLNDCQYCFRESRDSVYKCIYYIYQSRKSFCHSPGSTEYIERSSNHSCQSRRCSHRSLRISEYSFMNRIFSFRFIRYHSYFSPTTREHTRISYRYHHKSIRNHLSTITGSLSDARDSSTTPRTTNQ